MTTKNTAYKKSFFRTILFSFITVSLLTTVTLTAFLTLNYIRSSVSIVTKYNQNLLSQTNYTIDQMNQNVDRLTKMLLNDNTIVSFLYLKNDDSLSAIQASRTLDKQLVTMPYIESIYLYNASMDTFFSSKTGELLESGKFSDEKAAQLVTSPAFISDSNGIPVSGRMNGTSTSTISYYVFDATASGSEQKNAIVVNVFSSFLTSSIRSINQFNNGMEISFVVMDQEDQILCSILNPQLAALSDLTSALQGAQAESKENLPLLTIDGTRYLKSVTLDNKNNWYLMSLIPARIIFHDILRTALLGAGIMALVLILCLIVCLYFTKRLNSPIQAISDIMNGKETDHAAILQGTEEFDLILSSFESMREQNRRFGRMKQETAYSIRQDYLNHLITGNSTDSLKQAAEKLQSMNLSYLFEHSLCMITLKIDNYRSFCTENNANELWVLRFAIANILEDITGRYFTGNVLSRGNDKFIILLDCKETMAYKELSTDIEAMIAEIQSNIKQYMKFTMTAAYSSLFRGLEHLPSMACNMEDSLLLKMKYGHEAVISPYLVDEMSSDVYQFPVTKTEQLILAINDGKQEPSMKIYGQITSLFFHCDYDEILSGSIHLLYSIYLGVQKKHPYLKENYTRLLKEALSRLEDVEIADDLNQLMEEFIEQLCMTANTSSDLPQENGLAVTNRICEIIKRDYPNPSLCLSSIAEEIGLTPNYIGKMFKANEQKSVSQYILDYRMEMLSEYLKDSRLPLNTILDKVGIEKTNYFYTQFKKHFGVSLVEYKMNLEAKEPSE